MKLTISCLLILGFLGRTYGLDCYDCNDAQFDGETVQECFNTQDAPASPATATATCAADGPGSIKYCRTHFVINDGVTTAVTRACIGTDADEDDNTAAVPTADKCTAAIDATTSSPTNTINCYFHCTTDKCNTEVAASLKKCATDCGSTATPTAKGSCNYLTGTCVCAEGFSGSDCATADSTPAATGASRKCVQCNSDTDSNCASSTTSVDCPGTETYCSSTTSVIYDPNDAVILTITAKGCTDAFKAVDQCTFDALHTDPPISDAAVGYKEFNCFSTCDTDDCNTNTADGVINGNEAVAVQCVQCTDATGAGGCNPDQAAGSTRSVCPSGTTHCKSTVTYLKSDKADLSYSADPGYALVSVVRECATASVTTACTETSVGSLSFKKVTCTETCQGDGCNIGWPARPNCITCSTSTGAAVTAYDTDDYDQCLENPPMAEACSTPYHEYCYVHETGIEKGTRKTVEGYPRRITRGCSSFDIGNGCSSSQPRDTEIETCNRTCTTDGCNVGSGSLMPLVTLLTFFLPATLGWLIQRYF